MSRHDAEVAWTRTSATFLFEDFNRDHTLRFQGGAIEVPGDSIPAYHGAGGGADPEALFAAALSACHMMSFLAVAARMRIIVDAYEDKATATVEQDGASAWVSQVVLRPRVSFAGTVEPMKLAQIHDLAHRHCFLTRSVKAEVSIEPRV